MTKLHTRYHRDFSRNAGDRQAADRAGTMAIRLDDYFYDTGAEDGVQAAIAVWGTSLCSGDKVLLRLSTPEEEARDGNARGISPHRRTIEVLRAALPNPADLPEEQRPVWRCDQARPILDEDGRPCTNIRFGDASSQSVEHTWMRCSWITTNNPYMTHGGEPVYPQGNMECSAFSTVNVSLLSGNPGQPDYFRLYTQSVRQAVQDGATNYAQACSFAARTIVDAWRDVCRTDPRARFGSASVTTWEPDSCIRLSLRDVAYFGENMLGEWLSRPDFAPQTKLDSQGNSRMINSPLSPECLVRLLDDREELCGVVRVRSWDLVRSGTPENQARFIVQAIQSLDQGLVRRYDVSRVDILPGLCRRVSSNILQPEAQTWNTYPAAAYQQARNLIFTGLLQNRAPAGMERESIGCAQAYVPRVRGYVSGFHTLRDGIAFANASLLLPFGERLTPHPDYASGLNHERQVFSRLDTYMNAQEEARNSEAAQADRFAGTAAPTSARTATASEDSECFAGYEYRPAHRRTGLAGFGGERTQAGGLVEEADLGEDARPAMSF